jgi:hypothetical protein
MGIDITLFYIWFVISVTALFYALGLILEYFVLIRPDSKEQAKKGGINEEVNQYDFSGCDDAWRARNTKS